MSTLYYTHLSIANIPRYWNLINLANRSTGAFALRRFGNNVIWDIEHEPRWMITRRRRRRKRQGLAGQHHDGHVPDNRMIKNIARQSITKGILFICAWTGTDGVRIRRVRFANWRVCGICWIVLTTVHTNRPNQLPKIYYIQPCTMMIITVGNMDRGGGGGVAGGGFWNDIHISRSAC